MKDSGVNGLLVLDKPSGMTSRMAVDRAQRWFPRGTKIGHTGTLDPLATGVLVLCLGQATRLAEYVQRMRKTYTSTFLLGSRSDTDDADGTVTEVMVAQPPSLAEIESALSRFVGEIDQVPPAYSAAKVTGQRAYDLARRGEEVDLKARRVSIDRIEVRQFAWPRLEVEVHCGKGTYIRSLARDLGEVLGCGGLVEVLRRSQVGPFEAAHAVSWDADRDTVRANLKSIFEALSELPCIEVVPELATRLRQGQSLKWQEPWPGDEAVVVETDGSLVAVVRLDRQARCLRPEKVIAF